MASIPKDIHAFNPENLFFTSDTHFSHENIIRFCGRPFSSVEEMNEEMIRRWNEKVPEDGVVFHLGDFAFGNTKAWTGPLDRLHGKIHLILGNHDIRGIRQSFRDRFESIYMQRLVMIDDRRIYLNHYPFLCYAGTYRSEEDAVWQLFGHVHTRPADANIEIAGRDDKRMFMLFPHQYDVGVDLNDFTPLSYYEVKEKIEEQVRQHKDKRGEEDFSI